MFVSYLRRHLALTVYGSRLQLPLRGMTNVNTGLGSSWAVPFVYISSHKDSFSQSPGKIQVNHPLNANLHSNKSPTQPLRCICVYLEASSIPLAIYKSELLNLVCLFFSFRQSVLPLHSSQKISQYYHSRQT